MSWFKKIFGSQYGFNPQSSSQGSSQGSLQEPKVHYVNNKTETDGNETEIENLTVSKVEECDDTTQSNQDSCYSWSGVNQEIKKLVFIQSWENTKKLNICNFYFRIEKVNHVNKNRISNFIYMYGIQNTEENFNKIGQVIEERKFIIYRKMFYTVDNCQIIEEDSTGIIIEIDLLEHQELLKDLTNYLFTKKISTGKVEKNWTHLFCGESILNNQNLQCF